MRRCIVWVTDTPGWAYDNRARRLAEVLVDYDHEFVCYPQQGFWGVRRGDIVVCPDPRILPLMKGLVAGVLVQHLNAVKIFWR